MLSAHLCEEFNDHLESLGSEGSGQLNVLIKYSLLTSIIYIVLKFPVENSRYLPYILLRMVNMEIRNSVPNNAAAYH